jgi:hypothetical protein
VKQKVLREDIAAQTSPAPAFVNPEFRLRVYCTSIFDSRFKLQVSALQIHAVLQSAGNLPAVYARGIPIHAI